jgi:sugar fermentation stimulation protein A
MIDWLYNYPILYPGILLKRYKRFFADVQLDSGEVVTAHCPNTGPMTGVSTVGSAVQISKSDNPNRKLGYTLELIQVNDHITTWVGVNTALPNRVIKLALEKHLFPELGEYQQVKGEVVYGKDRKSRVDFSPISRHRNHQRTKAFTGINGDFTRKSVSYVIFY